MGSRTPRFGIPRYWWVVGHRGSGYLGTAAAVPFPASYRTPTWPDERFACGVQCRPQSARSCTGRKGTDWCRTIHCTAATPTGEGPLGSVVWRLRHRPSPTPALSRFLVETFGPETQCKQGPALVEGEGGSPGMRVGARAHGSEGSWEPVLLISAVLALGALLLNEVDHTTLGTIML